MLDNLHQKTTILTFQTKKKQLGQEVINFICNKKELVELQQKLEKQH